jgi:RNA polymerase sigma-70 factor (ECF subfamily)
MNAIKEKILLLKLRITKSPEAFGELYDLYNDRIYRFILFKVGSKEEAQDLTAETFLKCWNHISRNKPIVNLNALLYSIGRNLVIDYYRKQKAEKEISSDEILEIIPDAKAEKVLKNINVRSESEAVFKAMDKIDGKYKEILILKFIDELTNNEISEITGMPEGNVRVTAHRATEALKKVLNEQNEIYQ